MSLSKFIGSILIVVGTTVGAGMLALPLVSAPLSGYGAIGTLVAIWGLMTITGLLVLEVNLSLDATACSFSSMAENTLGPIGKIVAWLSCLLLLYALTVAYIAGASSLLKELFKYYLAIDVPNIINALLFVLILGGAVFWSTQATDLLNRGLISIKGGLLVVTIMLFIPHIDWLAPAAQSFPRINHYFFAVFPIFICAFGYHTVIPSIRIYFGASPKELRHIIILGTAIALIIYIIWLWVVLNIVPLTGTNSFEQIASQGSSVGGLVGAIGSIVNNKWVMLGLNGFSNIAMTTSFLGVTLGLFDFIADGFKHANTRIGRLKTAGLTFGPPLIGAIYWAQGFILALNYAAIFVIILEIILPALMVYSLRYGQGIKMPRYRVGGGKILLGAVIMSGIGLLGLQILIEFTK